MWYLITVLNMSKISQEVSTLILYTEMPNQTKNIYTLRNYILVQSQLYFTCTKFPWSLFTKLHYAEYEHKSVQGYVRNHCGWINGWTWLMLRSLLHWEPVGNEHSNSYPVFQNHNYFPLLSKINIGSMKSSMKEYHPNIIDQI